MAGSLLVGKSITVQHVREVAADIRANDRAEIEAMYGKGCSVRSILQAQASVSKNSQPLLIDGKCIALFGCEPTESGAGVPWLIGSQRLREIPLRLTRDARAIVAMWRWEFGFLSNTVWGGSESLNWLRSLGFSISDSPAFVVDATGEPFLNFSMEGI